MALRGHKQPLQGASETSALGACGKELIQGLRGRFKWSWGWRYRLAGTQSSPRVGYGASALRVMAQEVPTHVNKLLVGWRCLCTPALGQYHASPRPRTASLAHALAAPQQGRHVTLPALLVEEVGSVGLVRRGLHLPRWIFRSVDVCMWSRAWSQRACKRRRTSHTKPAHTPANPRLRAGIDLRDCHRSSHADLREDREHATCYVTTFDGRVPLVGDALEPLPCATLGVGRPRGMVHREQV